MFKINTKYPSDPSNYRERNGENAEWLVMHYTANPKSTAAGEAKYRMTPGIGTGFHLVVDDSECYLSTPIEKSAQHCGGGLQGTNGHAFYKKCMNANSIGIEMCCRQDANGKWYITEETYKMAVQAAAWVCETYTIDPSHIIRHYDVTGKICPRPWVEDESKYHNFIAEVSDLIDYKTFCKFMTAWLEEQNKKGPKDYQMEALAWADQNGLMKGDTSGNQMPQGLVTRGDLAVLLDRYDAYRINDEE